MHARRTPAQIIRKLFPEGQLNITGKSSYVIQAKTIAEACRLMEVLHPIDQGRLQPWGDSGAGSHMAKPFG